MTSIHNEASGSFASKTLCTLSAFFDDRSKAESAIRRLEDIGMPNERIRFMPGYETEGDVARSDHSGFWAGLADWFFPDEDRAAYAEGLRRGGFLVSVQVDDQSYESAHDILDDEGSIDMDERADLWRDEGWDGGRAVSTFSEDALAPAPDTDRETTDLAERGAPNRRDLERSTPRVRSYRYQSPIDEVDTPAPSEDEVAPPPSH
ncbi:hypothetical protein SAMN05216228_102275 [Rhizobium tibeticum]|uniref:Uncharacterized protein n=1 Tax=Rhizobium tibeticum TaxID=501024 RepID=A0A1H8RUC8_9HYPH|nr:hypothetical protein [Rhizobium tibeticum]SEI08401.1 hypothetical protein RTCCBAU85039_4327 [Rhizobium tibeticum]SEO70071.1 hypothetical protein SAMN05216228_102275 [Rhizobium tibeticum]